LSVAVEPKFPERPSIVRQTDVKPGREPGRRVEELSAILAPLPDSLGFPEGSALPACALTARLLVDAGGRFPCGPSGAGDRRLLAVSLASDASVLGPSQKVSLRSVAAEVLTAG